MNDSEEDLGQSQISKKYILKHAVNQSCCINLPRLRTKDASLGQRERVENSVTALFFPSFIHEYIAMRSYSSGEANLWNIRFTRHAEARWDGLLMNLRISRIRSMERSIMAWDKQTPNVTLHMIYTTRNNEHAAPLNSWGKGILLPLVNHQATTSFLFNCACKKQLTSFPGSRDDKLPLHCAARNRKCSKSIPLNEDNSRGEKPPCWLFAREMSLLSQCSSLLANLYEQAPTFGGPLKFTSGHSTTVFNCFVWVK